MRRCSVLWLVGASCYHPADLAHCAITCDPLANNCPGEMVCGTDRFCHGPGERVDVCVAEVVDALRGPDAFIIRLDAGPDARPDGGTSCVHEWVTDFSSDPTLGTGDHWVRVGGGNLPVAELQPSAAPTYWAARGEQLTTSGLSAFATATALDVSLHALLGDATIQLNVNGNAGGSSQLTITVTPVQGGQIVTLANSASTPDLFSMMFSDAYHRYQLAVKPAGGGIAFAVDGVNYVNQTSFDLGPGSITGGVTLIASNTTEFDGADVCTQ